jgi:hypothetical protein
VWKYHPKHVEQFPDINKLCNAASFWIYIGILLGAHPILYISRIRVKEQRIVCYVAVVQDKVGVNQELKVLSLHFSE